MPIDHGLQVIDVLLNVDNAFLPKARWAMGTLCDMVGCRARFHNRYASERVHIYYGPRTDTPYPVKIRHNPDASRFFSAKSDYPDNMLRFSQNKGEMLPFLFSQPGDIFHVHGKQILLHKDIISSAFYFLSCWGEHVGKRYPDGRYRFQDSMQYRWDLAHTPVVDRYAGLLRQAVRIALPQLLLEPRWPNEATFALSLSHDLDYWNYWSRGTLAATHKYNMKRLFRSPARALYKLVGHTIDKTLFYHPSRRNGSVLQREQRLGYHSTTFVLSDPEMTDPRQNYLVEETDELKDFLTIIDERSAQLHGAGKASFELEELRRQATTMQMHGYACRGYRAHNLRFDYDKTFAMLEELGFDYDSSLGWWEHTGFRAGTSMPFAPYNIAENRPFSILEIPLSVMDTTLWSPHAMRMTPERASRSLNLLLHQTARQRGHLGLLWHYRTFDPVDFPKWRTLYWSLIEQARRAGGWICSLDQLADHWNSKTYI